MKQFKVLRVENEIMELFIAYGLCKILTDNEIYWKLLRKKSYYLIEVDEDFSYKDLILPEITMEDGWSLSPIHTSVEKESRILTINRFFNDEEIMEAVFTYYEDVENYILNKNKVINKTFKKEPAVFSGTGYYTKGLRGDWIAKAHSILDVQMNLAFLGFIFTTSYVKSDAFINAVLIPHEIYELQIPFSFTSIDKETAEIKRRTYFGNDSIALVNARLYVESLKKLKSESIIDKYESILFMKLIPTGNKPMADKKEKVSLLNTTIELYDQWLQWLTWSIYPDDVKYALAQYLTKHSISAFENAMKVISKKNVRIQEERLKEWLQLTPGYVQQIYSHPTIIKIGKGLNRLLYSGKGYSMQVSLLNVKTFENFFKAIRNISLDYKRVYGYSLLEDKELQELMTIIPSDEKKISLLATAIITYGNTFFGKSKKQNKNQIDGKKEVEVC